MSRTVLVAAALLPVLALATACGGDDDEPTAKDPTSSRTHAALPDSTDGPSCEYGSDGRPASREVDLPSDKAVFTEPVKAVIETSQGDIPIALDASVAPCTVNSFASLTTQGFYDDTECHRLTGGGSLSVLQCGDPDATGMGGPGYAYADELDALPEPDERGVIDYPAGTLAMANAGPNTNGSQFFMVYEDSLLPPSYTQFGTISDEGLEALRKIAEAGDESGYGDGPPATHVQIEWVELELS